MTVADLVDACVEGRSSPTKTLLKGARSDLRRISRLYVDAASDERCWALDPSDFTSAKISDEEMKKAYRNLLVRGAGRNEYDKIIARAKLKRCVYCEESDADTLDHFLPITEYSALGLDPWNLIPACQPCNKKLLAVTANDSESEHIHPYFWKDSETWLTAVVLHHDEPLADFDVSPPSTWPPSYASRVSNYFSALNLRGRYLKASAGRIIEIADSLVAGAEVHNGSLENAAHVLRATAVKDAKVRGDNHWGVVLQRALADDAWFCEEWIYKFAQAI